MESNKDAKVIQEIIVNNSGVIATEISLSKKEVTVIYNDSFLAFEKVINSIEDLGYIII
jgi:copper chaperone CopZ